MFFSVCCRDIDILNNVYFYFPQKVKLLFYFYF